MADRPDVAELKEQIAQGIQVPALIETVGKRLGASFNAKAVFGAPVERGVVTIIPVARAAWGYGAGGGVTEDAEQPGSGGGGGGGGIAGPIGYIEITDRGATYHRIEDPLRRAGAAALTALATGLVVIARTRRKTQ
jgi:uncharacterized spore protein YtfJ